MSIQTLLYILALILFVLAAIPIQSRIGLGWLGLAVLTLTLLI